MQSSTNHSSEGLSSGYMPENRQFVGRQHRSSTGGFGKDTFPIDASSRDALFAEFGALVRKLVGQYGDDAELRQDLEGEIYRRFCTLVDVYQPERQVPLRPYLVRQLTASTYTFARRRWRERQREVHYDDLPLWISADLRHDPTPDWDDALSLEALRKQLPAALATLSARQQSVVIARYFDDLSFEQIAENLGVRPATARSLLRHALNHLRRVMPER